VTHPVLFVHYGQSWIRGSENALALLLARLDRNRFRPRLLCNQAVFAQEVARRADVETTLMPIPEIMIDRAHRRLEIPGWLRAVRRLRREIRQHEAELLYSNSGLPSQAGHYAARSCGIPLVAHVHCLYDRRYLHLYRLTRASHLIFGGEALQRENLRKAHFAGSSSIVRYGVDCERFRPAVRRKDDLRAALGIAPDSVVIGQVASLIARKGGDVLLEAFARLSQRRPATHLVLVGGGAEEREFRALAERLGISDRVTFSGPADGADAFYQHVFDIHVLASRGEGLPLAALEAAACGLPQVGANVAGIPEIVRDGRTGLLFASEDVEALAERLDWLAGSPALRRELGQSARRLVQDRFSLDAYVRGIEDVLERTIETARHAEGERRPAAR
jgi:glycosyltransferase involved in cell wall biosynthesis